MVGGASFHFLSPSLFRVGGGVVFDMAFCNICVVLVLFVLPIFILCRTKNGYTYFYFLKIVEFPLGFFSPFGGGGMGGGGGGGEGRRESRGSWHDH